ncbi:hypothetical protein PISMIDRAFT_20405 [Pisolithus microcarpus 441]|uniref:Uncharacterized protein n=1 Tax=Pisolithus microcarpus 441 TaxID=765257 RepID=A0A0C9YQW4_9AGAM|nr:hypothetical protein PISMIDRAFT_20405 [Pisolithus microcarpus 441]
MVSRAHFPKFSAISSDLDSIRRRPDVALLARPLLLLSRDHVSVLIVAFSFKVPMTPQYISLSTLAADRLPEPSLT